MQVHVLYFGVLKELLKRDGERMELPPTSSVGDLLEAVRGAQPESAGIWKSLAVAVNLEYVGQDRELHEDDEVALLPPVSGGAGSMGHSASPRSAEDVIYLQSVVWEGRDED